MSDFSAVAQQVFPELFISNDELEQFRLDLQNETGKQRVIDKLKLAWHLRQRDGDRALILCDEIEADLSILENEFQLAQSVLFRVLLIRAETRWLDGALVDAIGLAETALQGFTDRDDALGKADSHWLLSFVRFDAGMVECKQSHLEQCILFASEAGDEIRVEAARACLMFSVILDGTLEDTPKWLEKYLGMQEHACTGLRTWVYDFLGGHALNQNEHVKAAAYFMQTMNAANDSGQIFRAIIAMHNVCSCFIDMNDNQAALDWSQRNLEFARTKTWPRGVANALTLGATVFRNLHDLNSAYLLLKEALQVLQHLQQTRTYAMTLRKIGDVVLEQGDYPQALSYFDELIAHPVVRTLPSITSVVLRGRALSLLRLERGMEAMIAGQEALRIAQENHAVVNQIDAKLVLAEIYQRYPQLYAAQSNIEQAANIPSLELRLQAIHLGRSIADYIIPVDLLEGVAQEYAQLGDYRLAYQYVLDAIASREKIHSDDIKKGAMALQTRLQTERSLIEAENAKKIAIEQKSRLELLEQQNDTLSKLGQVGQEITTLLRTTDIYQMLSQHVHGLMRIDNFSIWLLDENAQLLQRAYGMEMGQLLETHTTTLDNTSLFSVRCIQERREILANADDNLATQVIPGTLRMESLIFSPLILGQRVIGLMTVQSRQKNAFHERELLIFRTLCSYAAIALDNARAYGKLKETQKQLVEQEKMAALGGLVAGVAHEINTPLGICVTATSHMQEEVQLSLAELDAGTLSEDGLRDMFDTVTQSLNILSNNTARAAKLIRSFKQVAVDQSSDEIREFTLHSYLAEVLLSLQPKFRGKKIHVNCDCDKTIQVKNLPGALSQILTNMIMNSLIHGFEEREQGTIGISVQVQHEQIMLHYSDDGMGMDATSLSKLFDPFYTTKRGQGGSGLGAHIIYNLATSALGGTISVNSIPGKGLFYELRFPQYKSR